MRVKLVHDFIAFLVALLVGVLSSYHYPLFTSFGVFLFSYAGWMIVSSYMMTPEIRYALDPRLSRSALASILVIIATLMVSIDAGLDARAIGILLIIVIIALVTHIYVLSRRIKRA